MPLSIRLDPESEARLSAIAKKTGRSKTFYIREAIRAHLDELEEIAWAEEAVKEWVAQDQPSRAADAFWAELDLDR